MKHIWLVRKWNLQRNQWLAKKSLLLPFPSIPSKCQLLNDWSVPLSPPPLSFWSRNAMCADCRGPTREDGRPGCAQGQSSFFGKTNLDKVDPTIKVFRPHCDCAWNLGFLPWMSFYEFQVYNCSILLDIRLLWRWVFCGWKSIWTSFALLPEGADGVASGEEVIISPPEKLPKMQRRLY